jgi:hypothetical protein
MNMRDWLTLHFKEQLFLLFYILVPVELSIIKIAICHDKCEATSWSWWVVLVTTLYVNKCNIWEILIVLMLFGVYNFSSQMQDYQEKTIQGVM